MSYHVSSNRTASVFGLAAMLSLSGLRIVRFGSSDRVKISIIACLVFQISTRRTFQLQRLCSSAEHGGRTPEFLHRSVAPVFGTVLSRWGVFWTQAAPSGPSAPAAVQRWVSTATVQRQRDATSVVWQRRPFVAPVWERTSTAAFANGQREAVGSRQRSLLSVCDVIRHFIVVNDPD